jgi:hypothetical protein
VGFGEAPAGELGHHRARDACRDYTEVPLAPFDRSNEMASFKESLVRAGVKPCKTPPRQLHTQLAEFEISSVQVCNLELTTP